MEGVTVGNMGRGGKSWGLVTMDLAYDIEGELEGATIQLEGEREESLDLAMRSLVGKILLEKPLNRGAIKQILTKAWGEESEDMEITEMSTNVFMFTFLDMRKETFNEIRYQHEKQGLRPQAALQMALFGDWIHNSQLMDLALKGCRFTWVSNPRAGQVTKEKLDRVFVNWGWRQLYPHASAIALPAISSDTLL
ncbi:Endonuclease/exonuclease/phosphatase superfamily [Sesbania bispinosa]|nr:Endonuclease/exonuclease/phosphatase superfamily [Sesbania bispinosa]